MQICQGRLLLAGEAGVCVLPSLPEKGMIRLRSEQALISLAVMDGQAFAGSQAGQLWQSRDGGTTWMPVELPRQGLPVLALASLRQSRGFLLAAALLNERAEQIEIWRTRYDALGERLAEWDCWLSEKSIFRSVVMCLAGESGEESWFGIGDALLFRQAGQWRRKQLATHSAPVAALTKIPGSPNLLAAAGSALFCGGAQGDWVKAPGLPLAFVDFGLTGSAGQADAEAGLSLTSSARQDEDLIGLTSTGEIYRLLIEK
jgi:hypothetical protein